MAASGLFLKPTPTKLELSAVETRARLPALQQLIPKDGAIGRTTLDIIAVHGIETQSPRTWTAYERDEEPRGRACNWLADEDMLHQTVPQARIWTYDYNSRCYSDDAQEIDILGLGQTFLEVLYTARSKGIGANRPLIFIGSCFGGIVVIQALEKAIQDPCDRFTDLTRCVAGTVFLGTPLRGTAIAGPAQSLAYLRGLFGRETSETTMKGLRERDAHLHNIVQNFARWAFVKRVNVGCFYETRQTSIASTVLRKPWANAFPRFYLVTRESACLDGHRHQALDVQHSKMNKFRGPEDVNFILVADCLKNFAENALFSYKRTSQELQCLQCLASNYLEGRNLNKTRVPGTCMWVLENKKFLNWRQSTSSDLLWVSADPGCGKSVLSKSLLDEGLLTDDSRMATTCYFFFKDDDDDRKSAAGAVSALLHQLCEQRPILLRHAMHAFELHGQKLCTMFSVLWDIFEKAVVDPSAGEIVCLLDAIDECKASDVEQLIERLSRFYSGSRRADTKVKFLLTSRPYHYIYGTFSQSVPNVSSINLRGDLESDQIKKEIDMVIDHEVPRIASARRTPLDPKVQEVLVKKLKGVQNRSYLWLHLILDVVRKSLSSTVARLEILVEKMPQTVDDVYEKILQKIDDSDLVEDARRFLHIVVGAARPMTVREMSIALALNETLDTGQRSQSFEDLDIEREEAFQDRIRDLCGLFVMIVDSKIHLLHQTAKEFLVMKSSAGRMDNHAGLHFNKWKNSLDLRESNTILAQICVSYLLLEDMDRDVAYTKQSYSLKGRNVLYHCDLDTKTPVDDLLDYASSHWAGHFQAAGISPDAQLSASALKVCDGQSNRFLRWVSATQNPSGLFQQLSYTSLMIVSALGFESIVRLLQLSSWDVNAKSRPREGELPFDRSYESQGWHWEGGRTPLMFAALEGHLDVAKSLLAWKDIDVNSQDVQGKTALHLSASSGNVGVVTLLLCQDDIDVNVTDDSGKTPLDYAFELNHPEVVDVFLRRRDISIFIHDSAYGTPILSAIQNKFYDVAKLMLQRDNVRLALQSENCKYIILAAVRLGQEEIATVVIERVDVDSALSPSEYETTIGDAVKLGQTEVLKLLLERNTASIDSQTRLYRKLVFRAVDDSRIQIAELLLQCKGVTINDRDSWGRTLLSHAVTRGNLEMLAFLLQRDGIRVNMRNESGNTPLLQAARMDKVKKLELLLRCVDIDINIQDQNGFTPISLAAKKGSIATISRLLQQRNVDVNLKDKSGRTPLSFAAERGRLEQVKLLLQQNDVDVTIADNEGLTPLTYARNGTRERRPYDEIVRLLSESRSHPCK